MGVGQVGPASTLQRAVSAPNVSSTRDRPSVCLAEQVWQLQGILGGHAHLGPVYEVDFHQCASGLRCPEMKLTILKPTRVLTTDPCLAESLRTCRCPVHEKPAHLEGTWKGVNRTKRAETYPGPMCARIAKAIFLNTEDEADSEEREPYRPEGAAEEPRRKPEYAAMIQKLHVNTGHASVSQMLRLAQRAKAPPAVVEAIQSFRCPICEELQSHRVAALHLGLDVCPSRT